MWYLHTFLIFVLQFKNYIMVIFRIEHKIDGYGMFRSRTKNCNLRAEKVKGWYLLSKRHCKFPLPCYDAGINRMPYRDEFCAFKSKEQLNKWVSNDEIKGLIKTGFRVLSLEVSNCVVGKHQVLFEKTNIISTKDISELFL